MKLCVAGFVSVLFSGALGKPTGRVPEAVADNDDLDVFDVLDSTNKSLVSSTQRLAAEDQPRATFELPEPISAADEPVVFDNVPVATDPRLMPDPRSYPAADEEDEADDDSDLTRSADLDPATYFPSTVQSHQQFDNDLHEIVKHAHHHSHKPIVDQLDLEP